MTRGPFAAPTRVIALGNKSHGPEISGPKGMHSVGDFVLVDGLLVLHFAPSIELCFGGRPSGLRQAIRDTDRGAESLPSREYRTLPSLVIVPSYLVYMGRDGRGARTL